MENILNKKGFIPVMLTPFNDKGEVDYVALGKLTELYLEAGAVGLFANCLSSEMFELTEAERLKTIAHINQVANGSVPVVATGTFGGSIEKQADFVKQVHDAGAEAVILLAGLIANQEESDAIFNDRVFELINKTEQIPLGFYECPVPYKRLLSPEQLGLFAQTGRVIYHKDTCLDIDIIKQKITATASHSNFKLYDAYMVHAVESLKAGSAGLSCIQGNYFPELIVWICENYDNPDCQEQVDLVQQFLVDNMAVMHEVYPTTSKYFLQKRGFEMNTFTRRNVGDFTKKIITDIDTLFDDYHKLQQAIALDCVMK